MKKELLHHILLLVIAGSSFISCEKPPEEEDNPRVLQEGDYKIHTGDNTEAVLDSIYLFASYFYLWDLPKIEEFNPSKFSIHKTKEEAINYLFKHITAESKGDDRWSWIVDKSGDIVAQSVWMNNNQYIIFREFGIGARPQSAGFVVSHVWPNSFAEKAGLRRGQRLSKFYIKGDVLQCQVEGEAEERSIQSQPFRNYIFTKITPMQLSDNIVKPVGYLFIDEFTFTKNSIIDTIRSIKKKDVSDLVIDLRYNRGGYGDTKNDLVNAILPYRLSGDILSRNRYNSRIESATESIAKKWPFSFAYQLFIDFRDDVKTIIGPHGWKYEDLTEFENIFFIVSKETGSAAEILINDIKTHTAMGKFKTKIIGKTTMGKGVGGFHGKVGGYKIYLISYASENSDGQRVPTSGINPDINVDDDFDHALGDPEEACFKKAIEELKKSKI